MSLKEALARAGIDFDVVEIGDNEETQKKLAPDVLAMRLRDHFADFNTKHEFKPGMLVRWKRGQRNARFPLEDQFAIVIETMEPKMMKFDDPSDRRSTMKFDIVLGVVLPDDTFGIYNYDSRFFEPVPEAELPATH